MNGNGYTNGTLRHYLFGIHPYFAGYSSGDTGVSASLVLRGTPPFQVHYRVQRDKEAPRELSKTFTSSRGELTLQPERSGHYIFTFVQMSDANYKKVELKGPSIDQVIHPLAAADFASGKTGGNKRMISSCEGSTVGVDVELRVSMLCIYNLGHTLIGSPTANRERVHGTWSCRSWDLRVLILSRFQALRRRKRPSRFRFPKRLIEMEAALRLISVSDSLLASVEFTLKPRSSHC